MAEILLVEDEKALSVSISKMLTRSGHKVRETDSAPQAFELIQKGRFDLVISDVNLREGNGIELVESARADGFDGIAVIITAFGTIETAVVAMKRGADDFLQKPLRLEELPLQVEKWLERRKMAQRLRLFERLERHKEQSQAVLGQSKAWTDTLRLAERLAAIPVESPNTEEGVTLPAILLMGETGAGKGVLARYIHQHGSKMEAGGDDRGTSAPFVHVNCSALPASLVEGELFGHERGAFTDAKEPKPGLFEMANGGTIFLDEISEMPLELQAKLLLVVEQGTYRRVGGTRDRTVRARVIAASNVDLAKKVEAGTFRRDLLYRLNAFTICIPPLRARNGDALRIAEITLQRNAQRYGRPGMQLSESAREAISSHDWPGNVRELVNTIQRAAMLCERDIIEPSDLGIAAPSSTGVATGPEPHAARRSEPIQIVMRDLTSRHGMREGDGVMLETREVPIPFEEGTSLVPIFKFEHGNFNAEAIEKDLLAQALQYTRWNVSRAAKLIGLTRASMRYRMERYSLNHEHEAAH
ncbi:MAG: sigma-54-dependent transcriptional regulator [Phycisphaerales bacterium]